MKIRQFAFAIALTWATVIGADSLARRYRPEISFQRSNTPTPETTIQALANSTVENREVDSRYTVYNIAKLSRHSHHEQVDTAFLGTSRTKLLKPQIVEWDSAVVSAGNSYGEISYSYLIEADVLKREFPNLKYVFVETSLLTRQAPAPDFVMTPDHRKYLPFLAALGLEMAGTAAGENINTFINQQSEQSAHINDSHFFWRTIPIHLEKHRDQFKISTLLKLNETQQRMPVTASNIFKQLQENGAAAFETTRKSDSKATPIAADDPKITRLESIEGRYPWSDEYKALAEWARLKQVTIVFFQPPVRSDFLTFQEAYGLELHSTDIEKLAQASGFPLIDLNVRSLGYADDWSLFSDADHLGTCKGDYVYLMALKAGLDAWKADGEVLPQVSLKAVSDRIDWSKTGCELSE